MDRTLKTRMVSWCRLSLVMVATTAATCHAFTPPPSVHRARSAAAVQPPRFAPAPRFASALDSSASSDSSIADAVDGASDGDWRAISDAIFNTDSRPVILFDGVCNMCNGGVNFALDWDPDGNFRFAALQSDAGRALLQRSGRSPDDISSIVLVDKEQAYIKSDAVLRIAKRLGRPFPAVVKPFPILGRAGLLFPRFGRNFVYDRVANNRYNMFGKSDSCRISDDRFDDRFVSGG